MTSSTMVPADATSNTKKGGVKSERFTISIGCA